MSSVAEKLEISIFASGPNPGNIMREFTIEHGRSLADGEQRPQAHTLFRILHQKFGDKRVVWDNRNLDQINEAKEMFDKLIEEGMVAYRVNSSGNKTPEVMKKFDPRAEEIIFAPIQALAAG